MNDVLASIDGRIASYQQAKGAYAKLLEAQKEIDDAAGALSAEDRAAFIGDIKRGTNEWLRAALVTVHTIPPITKPKAGAKDPAPAPVEASVPVVSVPARGLRPANPPLLGVKYRKGAAQAVLVYLWGKYEVGATAAEIINGTRGKFTSVSPEPDRVMAQSIYHLINKSKMVKKVGNRVFLA